MEAFSILQWKAYNTPYFTLYFKNALWMDREPQIMFWTREHLKVRPNSRWEQQDKETCETEKERIWKETEEQLWVERETWRGCVVRWPTHTETS